MNTTVNAEPKPDENIRFLRASAANQCNLNCIYCPKASGMENHVPTGLRNRRLTTDEYCENLSHIARSGVIQGISFTGGEPTLNQDLPILVERARSLFSRVEMTTNGRFLSQQISQLAPNVDVIKVSVDAADPELANQIVRGHGDDYKVARDAIRTAVEAGLTV